MTISRAAVLYAPNDLRVEGVPSAALTGEDAFVRVEACGVCGSDAGLLQGKIPANYPAVIGHEIVGVVEELATGASERHGISVGDRVVLEFPIRCGSCHYCIGGDYRLCDRAWGYGGPVSISIPPGLWGGMAERVYLSPFSMVHRVPSGLSSDLALLACAVLGNGIRWAVQLGAATLGSRVVVLGAGPQGLACMAAARQAGARAVIAVGRGSSLHRLEMALLLGATATARSDVDQPLPAIRQLLEGSDADLVVDTTGSVDGLLLAVPLVKKGGRVVVAGQSGAPHQPIPLDLAVEREVTIVGANSHDFRSIDAAFELLASGRFPFGAMITHSFDLDHAREAIETIRKPEKRAIKVVVRPQ